MLRIKCNGCKNELKIVGGRTYMCKKCHHFDYYKLGEDLKCKKCGNKEFIYPKLEWITCPKCNKIGDFEEVEFIQDE
ncbi:hypothetical protein ACFLZ7_01240 [Nanoarchaeota archaeon]